MQTPFYEKTTGSITDSPLDTLDYVLTEKSTVHLQLIKKIMGLDRGAVVVLSGPSGSGKRLLVMKGARDTMKNLYTVEAEELYEKGVLSTDKLIKLVRSTVSVVMKEQLKIIEGEVISISGDKLQLKTMDMESVFDIGVRMRKELERERICVGDILKIYKESCFVVKQGRSSDKTVSGRSDLLEKIPLPEGECIKTELVNTTVTLNELDILNFKEDGEEYLYTDTYTGEYIREEVDKKVEKLLKEDKVILERGVLIINGSEMLSEADVKTIGKLSSSFFHPSVFLIFNISRNGKSAGELNLKFDGYNEAEIREILASYCTTRFIQVDSDALDLLCKVGKDKGLCVAIKILKASLSANMLISSTVIRIMNTFD